MTNSLLSARATDPPPLRVHSNGNTRFSPKISASVSTSTTFLRLFRAWVSSSGTYATASAGSHAADIVIEDAAGSQDWLSISDTGFPRSQSEVAAYSVPLGHEAYLKSIKVYSSSLRTTNIIFFQRQSILDTAAPYQAMREVFTSFVEGGGDFFDQASPWGPFPELTDVGVMAKVEAQTGEVNVDFELLLRELY